MGHQLSHETLASLRITLQRLEESADSYPDSASLDDLRQILLRRISELEEAELSHLALTALPKRHPF
jgi:hypothetical protein